MLNPIKLTLFLLAMALIGAGCSESKPTADAAPATGSGGGLAPAPEPAPLSVTEADLRAPFYPGASIDPAKAMKMKGDKEETVIVEMKSTDPVAKIKEFYEKAIPGLKMVSFNGKDENHLMGDAKTEDGGRIAVTAKQEGDSVMIGVAYGKS